MKTASERVQQRLKKDRRMTVISMRITGNENRQEPSVQDIPNLLCR